MQLDKVIESRKSVRKYKDKKPNWRAIVEAIESARHVPVAGGIYSLKFVVVDDKEKLAQIAKVCDQDFIAKAGFAIVVCSNPKRTVNSYGKRGEKYLRQQAGAGIQNILLKLTELGLGSCWIGHFVDNQVKKAVVIPEDIDVEAVISIGYEMGKTKPSKKIDLDNILYFNKYGNKRMKTPTVPKL